MAVRQRKGNETSSSAKKSNSTKKKENVGSNKKLRFFLIFGALMAAVFGGYAWSYYKTVRAYTPLAIPKAVELIRDHDDDLKRLWGTYGSVLNLFFNFQECFCSSLTGQLVMI